MTLANTSNQTDTGTLVEVAPGVHLPQAAWTTQAQAVLTPKAIELVATLHRNLNAERIELLAERAVRQRRFDQGELPDYLDRNTEAVAGNWKVAELPSDLLRRRVEITGPVNSAKMVLNMLSPNADGVIADCAMLDFEDSMKPSWLNIIAGVHNVIGAIDNTLELKTAKKHYKLDPAHKPIVMVRCRGLHLFESNFIVDGESVSGGLFDLSLCFFHTVKESLQQGKTPKYYVPKCEHHLEARWWNMLFGELEQALQVPIGTLRATFLIETLTAAFQIEEILYEIREHAAGLNVGRWDKIFSDIKTLRAHQDRVLADRSTIDMSRPWMANYAKRLIEVCHARGAFAMGGMAAFTPGKDPAVREQQTAKVKADKRAEAELGHDGCWVSHPYFIEPALDEFVNDNQLTTFTDLPDKFPDLLPQSGGPITEEGLRKNIRVGIAYMHGWINDIGCVAWDDLMEDLATLEISRAQIWQWWNQEVALDQGIQVTRELVQNIFAEEYKRIVDELALDQQQQNVWELATTRARELFLQAEFPEFLTTVSEVAQ